MSDRHNIGGNNPPDEEKLTMLTPVKDIPTIVEKDVTELAKRADELISLCDRIPEKIEDEEVYDKVIAVVAELRKNDSERDDKRTELKSPYLKAGQEIDKQFKLINPETKEDRSKKVQTLIKELTNRLSEYDTKKYNEEREAAAKEAENIASKAREDGIEIPTENPEIKLSSRKSEHGGMSTRSVIIEWEITNEEELPRSVLSPDKKKIQELIDKGATIPGITVKERVSTVVKRT